MIFHKQNVELIVMDWEDDKNPSPDCSENPFLQKKIAMESGKKLQIKGANKFYNHPTCCKYIH